MEQLCKVGFLPHRRVLSHWLAGSKLSAREVTVMHCCSLQALVEPDADLTRMHAALPANLCSVPTHSCPLLPSLLGH